MRLKTLDIKGFKSFAERTVIHFGEDVIGIVGPNGCGKSNIVDSIRWVLGEQKTKELRSDKMENVIFNGTKDRKPAGAAEVSLTFENTKNLLPTEYHTVTVKRMLYRTGESEYQLNGVKCRLKDIANLLADTGMGPDSYAIIALGMVDDLLSDKEDARRRLFEQAAGIGKYKQRKKETLAKLEGTEADLARVEDLLFEIENNLKVLEKQARRARRYLEIKTEYKEASIELAIHRLSGYKASYKELEAQLEAEDNRKTVLDNRVATGEAALEKEKAANLDKEKALSERQRTLNTLVGRIRNMESDKKMLSQKTLFVQESGSKLEGRIGAAEARMTLFLEDVEKHKTMLEEDQRLLALLQADLDEAKAVMERIRTGHSAVKGELDTFLKEQQEAERKIFELERQKAVSNSKRDNAQRDIVRLRESMERRKMDISAVQGQAETLTKRIREQEGIIAGLESDENKRVTEIADQEKQQEKLQDDLTKLNRQLDAKRNEHKLTKSLVENLEGFPESIRFLSRESNWKTKAPLLSDILYTREDCRAAIENYLEPYLSYYVVQDREEAIAAIRLLETAQKGKANFFLLDEIREAKEVPTVEMKAISALGVVETDPQYQTLAKFLLGNVYISNAPVHQLIELSEKHPEVAWLSPTGSLAKRRFSLGGGSVGLFEGKRIGRQKNLELLEADIKTLEGRTKEITTAHEAIRRQLQTLREGALGGRIRQERDLLDRLHRERVSLQGQLDSFTQFMNESEDKIGRAEDEMEALDKEERNVAKQLAETNERTSALRESIARADSSYRTVADELSAASTSFNQKNIEFVRQQNKIAGTERELSFVKRQLEDTKRQVEQDKQARVEADAEFSRVQREIGETDRVLATLYEERRAMEKTLNEAEQQYYQSRGDINKMEDEVRQANRQRQDCVTLLSALQNKFNELKLELTSLNERLKVEFDVRANDLINREPTPGTDRADLETKVERHRNALANFGEVNPMALEAFDEMKTRYDFIILQKQDLVNAKDSLLQTISEIETTATQRFLESFGQVRENFQMVFRSLFTEEDTCDLLLTDPDNPLESHINIVAKPKGKRPQTINQLSGGEKTLTATALLFSLYLLKPAPFCIFDEVDAPLDDANIDKFNNIIRKFSENSQFIIVTHNKMTMSAVDVIYGVTMQKQGISEVVPVDFRSLN